MAWTNIIILTQVRSYNGQMPIFLVFMIQKSMKETKNINTDVYIILQNESNEDYSAFLKLYANSFQKKSTYFWNYSVFRVC